MWLTALLSCADDPGARAPRGSTTEATGCALPEVCDGVDQDCDGAVDEGLVTDGAGCRDPGPPVAADTVATVTVTVRTGDALTDGTDDPDPELCLGEDACFTLGIPDWNDRESGGVEVYAFDGGGRPRVDFDRFALTVPAGGDAWTPAAFEVALDGVQVYCAEPGVQFGDGSGEVLTWTDPLGLHIDCATAWPAVLTHGPIVGVGETGEIRLWLRTSSTTRVAVYVAESTAALEVAAPVAFGYPRATDDFTWEAHLFGVTPGETWFYAVEVDGVRSAPLSFRALPAPGEVGVHRFAFGSCTKLDLQPAFLAVLAYEPDLFVFVGDNHYGDTGDLQALRQNYRWAHSRDYRAGLLATTPILATWDDHDFVGNNTLGDAPGRDAALQAFAEYWANPSVGTDDVPGVFTRASVGAVDWFLLDARYHRGLDGTLLGADQEAWLLDELAASDAVFKLVVSGSEWSYAGGTDSWAEYPAQRERIAAALVARGIGGVVLLSGDIHRSEFRRIAGPAGGYDLPELISSPLANVTGFCGASDEELLVCYASGPSFVTLEVDTTLFDPVLTASLRDAAGLVVYAWTIARSELEIGNLP